MTSESEPKEATSAEIGVRLVLELEDEVELLIGQGYGAPMVDMRRVWAEVSSTRARYRSVTGTDADRNVLNRLNALLEAIETRGALIARKLKEPYSPSPWDQPLWMSDAEWERQTEIDEQARKEEEAERKEIEMAHQPPVGDGDDGPDDYL